MEIDFNTLLMLIGLSVDIAGSFFIAKGFLVKNLDDIVDEATPRYGISIPLVKSFIYQKIDIVLGFTLLALGFICQIASYLINVDTIEVTIFVIYFIPFFITCLLAILDNTSKVLFFTVCRTIECHHIDDLLANHPNQVKNYISYWQKEYDLKKGSDEDDATFARRIYTTLKKKGILSELKTHYLQKSKKKT